MSIEEGRKGRDAGMQEAVEAANENWRQVAHDALDDLIAEGTEFSADDVWDRIAVLDPGAQTHNNSALGGIFMGAVKQNRIQRVRYEASRRKSRHAGTVAVYVPAPR